MIYSQLRENERTARYEVKIIAGNKCEPDQSSDRSGAEASASSAAAKARAKKTEPISTGWRIGQREEPCWVDLEAELRHFTDRAPMDLGLTTGEKGGAGAELLERLHVMSDDLYRQEALESFMQYLSMLNLMEYLRLVFAIETVENNAIQAGQVGIIGPEYFAQRKIALQLDLAEITEWLVAHGIGLPDLAIFYPAKYGSTETAEAAAAPKKRGRKKAGEEESETGATETASTPIPEALRYVVELIRLQQATIHELVKFVDDVQKRNELDTPRAAIEMIQREAAPWIDIDHFESLYGSMKHQEQLTTMRQQAAIERQKQAFDTRPRRGGKVRPELKKRSLKFSTRENNLNENNPLDEFAEGIEEDTDEAYERAMNAALTRPEGMEFMPEEMIAQNGSAQSDSEGGDPDDFAPRGRGRNDRRKNARPARRDRAEPALDENGQPISHDLFAGEHADGEHVGERAEGFSDEHSDDEHHDGGEHHEGEEHEGGEGEQAPRPFREGERQFAGREARPEGERGFRTDDNRDRDDRGGRGRHRRTRNRPRRPGEAPQGREQGPVHGSREPGPHRGGGRGPARQSGPPQRGGRGPRPGGQGGGRRGLDYDEVQPVSNYTPGLPPSAQPGALPPPPGGPRGGGGGGRPPKGGRKWRGKR